MLIGILLVVALIVGALLIWSSLGDESIKVPRRYDDERARQPAEIASARLVLSEFYLQADLPRRFGARVDQVYLTGGRVLVPVETKVRFRREARFEDIVELSVQASVLRNTGSSKRPWGAVASWGYVRIAPKEGPVSYLKVQLLDDEQLAALHDRYFAVQEGAEAGGPATPRNCRHCTKRSSCPVLAKNAPAA